MPAPRLHGQFDDCEEHTDRGQKSLGALSVLLMLLHAPFKIGDAPTIAIAHEPGYLLVKHAEVAEYLGFEFIHHPHSLAPLGTPYSWSSPTVHESSCRLMNNAVESAE